MHLAATLQFLTSAATFDGSASTHVIMAEKQLLTEAKIPSDADLQG